MKATLPDKSIAEKYGISPKELNNIYRDIFAFIKEKIISLDFTGISEEEFKKLKTSFMLPGLGKLGADYKRVAYLQECNKKNKENGRNKIKENQADVHVDSDDSREIH